MHYQVSLTANGQPLTVDRIPSKKRKWNTHSESYEEIQRAAERKTDRETLKRDKISKGEILVSLGEEIHTSINANFRSLKLKQRFMGAGLGA